MTIEEASEKYCIPIKILKEYEKISCKIVLNFVKTESKFMLY